MKQECGAAGPPEFLRDFGPKLRSPLESRWSMVKGWRWHTRSSRSTGGTPLVLVHGLVISSLYMIPLTECLARTGEVHAVDLPGFGRSKGPQCAPSIPEMAEFLVAWLDLS